MMKNAFYFILIAPFVLKIFKFCLDSLATLTEPAKWISNWGGEAGGGAYNTEKYCRPPWLADKKNFRILDALEWLKQ